MAAKIGVAIGRCSVAVDNSSEQNVHVSCVGPRVHNVPSAAAVSLHHRACHSLTETFYSNFHHSSVELSAKRVYQRSDPLTRSYTARILRDAELSFRPPSAEARSHTVHDDTAVPFRPAGEAAGLPSAGPSHPAGETAPYRVPRSFATSCEGDIRRVACRAYPSS